jgi:hypothetical protein
MEQFTPFVLNFEHSNFEIVSDFGFRYSDFINRSSRKVTSCPIWLQKHQSNGTARAAGFLMDRSYRS